ncbi:MAG TPA: zinc-domain-containing protein [Nitrososphaeraceae archaeon]|jgi:DNA-directed RNA polymerase subunit RPC12/RpoP|nr:zinc-domain-containing protein [Nitrososphaeraceae archaeon]HZB64402.1 zinc-domain-containing protein [Nitrososphaeraceae archaeon]
MLEAKCPKCDKTAEVNDEMTEVNCSYCLTKIPYEEYIEIMKEKALNMGIEFQNNWDRNPYSM